ncbi:probable actin-related protein Arp6 [Cyanidioschyzon merolae strain 10D]|jgi:actin-related protein 6|uniref:Probable actin-related protein Arp6 n=1 Tax=Cyanidioschyzon merolae (strain NIES-3377 / 10D) TaxID=280699 RepID=M1VLX7_CYAM1|nr:probable actin-related protein Arp6 [Cyanidioschyzon merolae strain 10D]BAM82803.1 probable actin-related protein Arp6 [Cyanidioschyzon merolae strain 10D]|eukprot:XP_005538839.1 probable actin-related protein Arp6 [Cyanidioschyzon merolae strain 10D]
MSDFIDASIILLDNGADTVKIGLLGDAAPRVHVNGLARVKHSTGADTDAGAKRSGVTHSPAERKTLCGAALEQCSPLGLRVRRPIDRGLVTDLALQAKIWSDVLAQEKLSLTRKRLVLTVPPLCPLPALERMLKTAFFYFDVSAVYVTCTAYAALMHHETLVTGTAASPSPWSRATGLVIDSGHSFTHVVPVFGGQLLNYAVRRLDVGGRLLNNYLKELISYRSWNLMKESFLVQRLKERVCYVCADLERELQRSRLHSEETRIRYLLPNETDRGEFRYGRVLAPEHTSITTTAAIDKEDADADGADETATLGSVLTLTNEHFLAPESLFAPQDTIQIPQAGIPEVVLQSLERIPKALWPALLQHVVLIGGNVRLRGFAARFQQELRSLLPAWTPVQVWIGERRIDAMTSEADADTPDPLHTGWFGLQTLVRNIPDHAAHRFWLTRDSFERNGLSAMMELQLGMHFGAS